MILCPLMFLFETARSEDTEFSKTTFLTVPGGGSAEPWEVKRGGITSSDCKRNDSRQRNGGCSSESTVLRKPQWLVNRKKRKGDNV